MFATAKNEYDLIREQNIKERNAYLVSDVEDDEAEEFHQSLKALQDFKDNLKASQSRGGKRKRGNGDYTFRFTGFIPQERRKSHRIAKLPPSHTGDELFDEDVSFVFLSLVPILIIVKLSFYRTGKARGVSTIPTALTIWKGLFLDQKRCEKFCLKIKR